MTDRTDLTGKYDFKLEYAPGGLKVGGDVAVAPDLFTALEKQLGLKLEKSSVQLDVLVIDHMDAKPSEN